MEIKDIISVWKDVFSSWRYSMLAIFVISIFYSINVLIPNFSAVILYYQKLGFFGGSEFFFSLFFGFRETITIHSFITLITIGILFGMLFSLIAYKTNMVKTTSGKIGTFGSIGIFLGILAPGCAACGIGLLSIFGIGAAALSFLPFDGLEISLLAISILGFSVFKISKDIKKGVVCEV